ncbi:unnamed protein product [Cylindrotheca closterium]|uniref:Uncharacterized protein n=1 Tax=Cylindrotheca closterium TaxID=2856 RepID=A0AAD2JPJ5_9STRA|nr:unnamed protein product [Cylindrotheca closterium]
MDSTFTTMLLIASIALTAVSVEALIGIAPSPATTSAGASLCSSHAYSSGRKSSRAGSLYYAERDQQYQDYAYEQEQRNNGGWNEGPQPGGGLAAEQQNQQSWNENNNQFQPDRPPQEEYFNGDVGYNNVNYNSFADKSNNQYYAEGQPYESSNPHQFEAQEYQQASFNHQEAQNQGYYPPNQEYLNDYQQQQPYEPPQEFNQGYEPPRDMQQQRQEEDYRRYPTRMNRSRPSSLLDDMFDDPFFNDDPFFDNFFAMPTPFSMLNKNRRRDEGRSSSTSLLAEMFDDPFFDDPFFDKFFSMPTPFRALSPFYRTRRKSSSNGSSIANSNFRSAFSMLDQMRQKMEVFSNYDGFLQRGEGSSRILLDKAERYLNDDVACRMALGVGNEDRIRLGGILGSASSMAYAAVWDGPEQQQQRQERRAQRNLQVAVEGPDPRMMEAVVKITAFEDDEIQSLTLQTRDGREISVPVIGRQNDHNNNANFEDGRFFNEDPREVPPPPGVIDAEVIEQGRR